MGGRVGIGHLTFCSERGTKLCSHGVGVGTGYLILWGGNGMPFFSWSVGRDKLNDLVGCNGI